MKILGVIPARGGSKGVPRKNVRLLDGKPLLAYTIEEADKCASITDLVLSTDDEEIRTIGLKFGAKAPFLRPSEFATDTAQTVPVVQHAVLEMEEQMGYLYDIVVLLQPTTPLRLSIDIDNCIKMILNTDADSIVSVVEVGAYHPLRMKHVVGDNILINYIDQGYEDLRPRQKLPPVYIRSGDLYVTRRNVILKQNLMVGRDCRAYVIPPERSVNIDTEFDFILAEYLVNKFKKK
jgi:CMP-N,N'-diacetyllegionaminic acid synthase